MEGAGLDVEVDPAGNMFGRSGSAAAIWTGSHLDTVPEGGKFDGALGVVAGIEAVERAGRGSVAVFREEERGCVGSRAFVERGELPDAFVELHIEQGPRLAGPARGWGGARGSSATTAARWSSPAGRVTPGRRRGPCATPRSSRLRPRSCGCGTRPWPSTKRC